MNLEHQLRLQMTRRQLFGQAAKGIGGAALASLLASEGLFAGTDEIGSITGGLQGLPHFPPKAKRVIYLFQSGAPSQIDLFDFKPKLRELHGSELPASARQGPKLTGGSVAQASLPVAASIFKFQQAGKSGAWISELLPHTAKIVDDIAIIKTVKTDGVDHEPGVVHIQAGFPQAGRPSMGAWVSYGLGSENQNLPGFVVLI